MISEVVLVPNIVAYAPCGKCRPTIDEMMRGLVHGGVFKQFPFRVFRTWWCPTRAHHPKAPIQQLKIMSDHRSPKDVPIGKTNTMQRLMTQQTEWVRVRPACQNRHNKPRIPHSSGPSAQTLIQRNPKMRLKTFNACVEFSMAMSDNVRHSCVAIDNCKNRIVDKQQEWCASVGLCLEERKVATDIWTLVGNRHIPSQSWSRLILPLEESSF